MRFDIGNSHDPDRLRFDHKPPAFEDRNETCATRLVYDNLIQNGHPVGHLADLVDLVHDGDAVTRRARSSAYQDSRRRGLHAHIHCLKQIGENDVMLFNAVALWQDAKFAKKRPESKLINANKLHRLFWL